MKKNNTLDHPVQTKYKLLDLYCGAGGCSKGYSEAGFTVTGIDIIKQPNYPFTFIQGKSCCYFFSLLNQFDVFHFSPPCQKYSKASRWNSKTYSSDLEYWVKYLVNFRKPFVIENVPGSPMPITIKLTGHMFGLNLQRTRFFYSNILLLQPNTASRLYKSNLKKQYPTIAGHGGKSDTIATWSKAMQINWMSKKELTQAIPPIYTKYIGQQLQHYLSAKNLHWCK